MIAAVGGAIVGIIGTIMIKKYFKEDTTINIYTSVIDLVAQLAIAAGIAALGFAFAAEVITALPFILGCLILYSAALLLDYIVFNYTKSFKFKSYIV